MGRVKEHKPRRARHRFEATVPQQAMFSWASQAMQYPSLGEPGITHTEEFSPGFPTEPIDCLLYYSPAGQLLGILNHYQQDMPPYEKAGNVNLWVHPDAQRMGIGTQLIAEADRRFGIRWEQQRFTEEGRALAERYLSRRRTP